MEAADIAFVENVLRRRPQQPAREGQGVVSELRRMRSEAAETFDVTLRSFIADDPAFEGERARATEKAERYCRGAATDVPIEERRRRFVSHMNDGGKIVYKPLTEAKAVAIVEALRVYGDKASPNTKFPSVRDIGRHRATGARSSTNLDKSFDRARRGGLSAKGQALHEANKLIASHIPSGVLFNDARERFIMGLWSRKSELRRGIDAEKNADRAAFVQTKRAEVVAQVDKDMGKAFASIPARRFNRSFAMYALRHFEEIRAIDAAVAAVENKASEIVAALDRPSPREPHGASAGDRLRQAFSAANEAAANGGVDAAEPSSRAAAGVRDAVSDYARSLDAAYAVLGREPAADRAIAEWKREREAASADRSAAIVGARPSLDASDQNGSKRKAVEALDRTSRPIKGARLVDGGR